MSGPSRAMDMEKRDEIRRSGKLYWQLNAGSLALALTATLLLVLALPPPGRPLNSSSPPWLPALLVAALLAVHEAIHYAALLAWAGLEPAACRFVVNWKALMPAVAFRAPVRVDDLRVVLLAPLLVTAAICVVGFVSTRDLVWAALSGVAVGAGTADLYWFVVIRRFAGSDLVVARPGVHGLDIYRCRSLPIPARKRVLLVRRLAFLSLTAGATVGIAGALWRWPLPRQLWIESVSRQPPRLDALGPSVAAVRYSARPAGRVLLSWEVHAGGREIARRELLEECAGGGEGELTARFEDGGRLTPAAGRVFQLVLAHGDRVFRSRVFRVPASDLAGATVELTILDDRGPRQFGQEIHLLRWLVRQPGDERPFALDEEGKRQAVETSSWVAVLKCVFL